MKIVYVVYREDNTMVFNSQVLEYLNIMKKEHEVSLMVFRNHVNFFKKTKVENKISKYVDNYVTLPSLPPLSMKQLDFDASRLRRNLKPKYKKDKTLLIICRGELATYIANKAFSEYKNKNIFFDNRGLPIEELEMRNESSYIFKKNKEVKLKATLYAKDNSDIYSFVTNNLREYLLEKYNYSKDKPFFIMPTLSLNEEIDEEELEGIKKEINYEEENFYVTYIGSIAAWQNVDQIFDLFKRIKKEIPNAILIFLTNGEIKLPQSLSTSLKKSIIIKSASHKQVKNYLQLSSVGLVLRNDDIVNKVAAPTKIAEYLTSNTPIIYDGEIGIIEDLKKKNLGEELIKLTDKNLMEKIITIDKRNVIKTKFNEYCAYFDMETNQKEMLEEIIKIQNKEYRRIVKIN